MAQRRISLNFPAGHRCSVIVGKGALAELPSSWDARWRQAAIIGDRDVVNRFGEAVATSVPLAAERIVVADFTPGEDHKTRQTKSALEDRLLDEGFGREGCVIGLGGGVSLDVAGFVAATYLRGVPSVYLPTSLLAQVDAAIGGKTAVNTPHGKNLIGAFHQPSAVLIDPELLPSLPSREWPNGLAELVKHGMVADRALFEWIESHAEQLLSPMVLDAHPLERSARIKGDIVCDDERESDRRSVLNFGHTVGHAVERASGYAISHGRAVAVGMLVEARVAVDDGWLPADGLARLEQLLERLGLGIEPATPLPRFDELVPLVSRDKKRRDDALRLALPASIGSAVRQAGCHTVPTTIDGLRDGWQRTLDRKGLL